jgi:ubiquinone/menaquinone biosynthesis C-methylase UbiE
VDITYSEYYAEGASARYDSLRLDRDEEIGITAAVISPLLSANSRVLEIGCGTGRYGGAFRKLRHTVTGLDVSFSQLVHARQKVSSLICAGAAKIPTYDASFDACLAVLMLHQLSPENRIPVFAEVRRILRSGGVFGIKTCSHDDLATRWVEGYFPSAIQVNQRRYPPIEVLRDELTSAGFVIEDVVPTRTVPSVAVTDLLLAVEQRHNTTLRLIPAGEFDDGLAALKSMLAGRTDVEVPQAHTHMLCRADKANDDIEVCEPISR